MPITAAIVADEFFPAGITTETMPTHGGGLTQGQHFQHVQGESIGMMMLNEILAKSVDDRSNRQHRPAYSLSSGL